jgi:hypothetical protein
MLILKFRLPIVGSPNEHRSHTPGGEPFSLRSSLVFAASFWRERRGRHEPTVVIRRSTAETRQSAATRDRLKQVLHLRAALQARLAQFEPQTKAQELPHENTLRQFNTFYEDRRVSVTSPAFPSSSGTTWRRRTHLLLSRNGHLGDCPNGLSLSRANLVFHRRRFN